MAIPFTPLCETPLRVDRATVQATMAPFIAQYVRPDDPEWLAAVRRIRKATARRWLKRHLFGSWTGAKRGQVDIKAEYEVGWKRTDFSKYAGTIPPTSGKPWRWNDSCMLANNLAGGRMRLLFIMRAIEFLKPRSVLEIGFGPGMNLMVLACRFPEIRFSGLELTSSGLAQAQSVQAQALLPEPLQSYAPEPLVALEAHRGVELHQGTAAELAFADGEFDLVFSSLALEQMEPVRQQALAEFARVAAHHALMLEPFRECNDRGLPWAYVTAYDYFRGRITDLPNYRLSPIIVTDDMPQKAWLRTCLVISEKRSAN